MSNKPKQPGGLSAGRVVKGTFATIGRFFATFVMVGIITGCIVACVLTVFILNYVGADDEIKLETEELGYTSTMMAYDKGGKEIELQQLYLPDNNRIWVDLADISEYVKEGAIAIEDKRFKEHQGVDWRRTFGAFVNMFIPGASTGGGSTITQQLIKNITEDDDFRVDRKVREIFRALNLEQRYTKDQILETYLNVVPFGAGTNGIESAAQTYFDKSASELSLAESACIVGITQFPTKHNPRIYPEENKKRQLQVLWEMFDQGRITEEEYDKAVDEPLNIVKKDVQQTDETIRTYFEDYVIETVLKDLQEEYGWTANEAFSRLYRGGYTIYTTVDTEMQTFLEEFYLNVENFPAINNKEYPQSAAVVIDPNGKILAMVGGREEKIGNRVFNRVTDATRHPGSSLKPIGPYAVGFETNAINWSTIIADNPINLAKPGQPDQLWPTNYYGGYKGDMTVAYAIERSVNTVAAKVVQGVGPEKVFEFLHDKLNFYNLVESTVINGSRFTDVMLAPMSLGALTNGVTPLEMVGGYQIFANGGKFTTPYCYTKVVDSNGRTILEADTTQRQVIGEDTSVILNKALQNVTTYGTGTDARLTGMPTAGKTGTAEHDKDQWFLGMTPYYVCAVWLGFDNETYVNEYGTTMPNTINYYSPVYTGYPPPKLWKSLMEPLHEGLDQIPFHDTEDVVSKQYCTITGKLATSNCTSVQSGWYKASVPVQSCPGHADVKKDGEEGDDSSGSSSSDDDATGGDSIRVPWAPED